MLKFSHTALFITLASCLGLTACNQTQNTASTAETAQASTTASTAQVSASATDNNGMVTINTVRGDVQLPVNPEPIAVYDMTLMQDLKALEVPVAGLPGKLRLESLRIKDAPSTDIGTLFEPNMEALNQLKPKAILVGSRMVEKYDQLSQVAPTLDLTLDTAHAYESSKQRLADLGKLYNKTEKAQQLQQDIDKAIADAKAVAQGKGNGLVILINGNKMSAFGTKSRFGFIHNEFGIPQADPNIQDSRHGQPVTFEYIQKVNPDWLFVLDRSSAIGEEGVGAKAVLDNPLMHKTTAWSKNQIVYLSPDSYLAFGGYYQWLADAKIISDSFGKGTTTASATASAPASSASTTASTTK